MGYYVDLDYVVGYYLSMFIWIVIIILVLFFTRKSNKNIYQNISYKENSVVKEKTLSDEDVFKTQIWYAKEIEQDYLPDSIGGRAIYIYRNLMNQWFTKLSSENRYNEEMIQKLRRDFIDYMHATREGSTASYLSFELEDKERCKEYDEEATILGRKAYSIENAFAAMMGKEAEEELNRIRDLGFNEIDNSGRLIPKESKSKAKGLLLE